MNGNTSHLMEEVGKLLHEHGLTDVLQGVIDNVDIYKNLTLNNDERQRLTTIYAQLKQLVDDL